MKQPNSKIFIFGTGGHSKSVIRIIEAEAKWNIYGLLVDPEYQKEETQILGYKIIGSINNISNLKENGITNCFVAIGNNQLRAEITARLLTKGIKITTIIHPTAVMMNNSHLGEGTMIHAQAVIGPDTTIGKGVIISSLTAVGHDSIIGDYAHLTPGVLIGGGVIIGELSFLGLGSVVLPGIKIGKNVQVSANSVVNKDLEDNVIVAGNPARVIKRNESF